MQKDHFYLILFSTTLTSFFLLLNYIQKKKKQKQNEEQKTEYLQCKSLFDFEILAKKLMKPHRYYYYNLKSGKGHTYQACRDYLDKQLHILPRVLIDVSNVSLKTTIFGHTYETPIIIAPTAFHRLAHSDGELATARAATEAECIYTYNWVYSTMAEDKILETTGLKFLQVYLTTPNEILQRFVSQAEQKGYRAIVLTCDDPTHRVRDAVLPVFMDASKRIDPELFENMARPNMNLVDGAAEPDLRLIPATWKTIEAIRKMTTLPILCKGILSPLDAQLAIKCGANGIIVSNHGGRQIDTTVPAIQCLEDIVRAVDGRAEVFVDTGIRTGVDILKALALGARGVLIGRPILYGLACGGQDGVKSVLEILKRELKYDMACCGVTSIDQINKDILYKHT